MADPSFKTTVNEEAVVVAHLGEGHLYYFPILPKGIVSLHGARIKANPKAKTEANKFVFLANNAARAALARQAAQSRSRRRRAQAAGDRQQD